MDTMKRYETRLADGRPWPSHEPRSMLSECAVCLFDPARYRAPRNGGPPRAAGEFVHVGCVPCSTQRRITFSDAVARHRRAVASRAPPASFHFLTGSECLFGHPCMLYIGNCNDDWCRLTVGYHGRNIGPVRPTEVLDITHPQLMSYPAPV